MSEDELGSNHMHHGSDSKPAPDSPLDLVRMTDMDGQLGTRGYVSEVMILGPSL